MVAFGADFAASDGRPATEVIVAFAEQQEVGKKKLWLVPEKKERDPVEPHRFLLVKTLLEMGVPLDKSFATRPARRSRGAPGRRPARRGDSRPRPTRTITTSPGRSRRWPST
jgi:hypothetical protein